jgi:outer membrane protein TolC
MKKMALFFMLLPFLSACYEKGFVKDVMSEKSANDASVHVVMKLDSVSVLEMKNMPALLHYLKQVRGTNKNLKALNANIQAAQFAANAVAGRRAPEINVGIEGGRKQVNQEPLLDKPQNNVALLLNTKWELDVWGKLLDEEQAAQLMVDQEVFNLAQAQNTVIAQAAGLWLDLWLLRRECTLLEERIRNAKNLEIMFAEQYRQGLGDYDDYAAQGLNVSELRSQIIENKAQEKRALHRLNILRGQAPDAVLSVGETELQPFLVSVPPVIDAAYLAERPDIQASFANLQIIDAQTRAVYKALLPQFSISVDVTKSGNTLADALSGGWLWQLVGNAVQPIFNAGQLRNQARRQSKQAEAALFAYEQLVLNAMEEVTNALALESALHKKWHEAKEREENLRTQVQSQKQAYLDSGASVRDYTSVQQAYLAAQSEKYAVLNTLLKNRVNLALALGMAVDA